MKMRGFFVVESLAACMRVSYFKCFQDKKKGKFSLESVLSWLIIYGGARLSYGLPQ